MLHEMPTHHNLEHYLDQYIAGADIGRERKEPLFRTARGRSGELTGNAMLQSDVWRIIRRRAKAAGIQTEIGCHSFRATITAYLKNGGKLEIAQQMAAHDRHAPPGSMIDGRTRSPSMKSSVSQSSENASWFCLWLTPVVGSPASGLANPLNQWRFTGVQLSCPFDGFRLGWQNIARPLRVRPSDGVITLVPTFYKQLIIRHIFSP
jgi:hypothetical protein